MNKRVFETTKSDNSNQQLAGKREFVDHEVIADDDTTNNSALEQQLSVSFQPSSSWRKKIFIAVIVLFITAILAQSVQWLIDSWLKNQWIYLAFSLVFLGVTLLGGIALLREWRQLTHLKKISRYQKYSQQLLLVDNLSHKDAEQGKEICLQIAKNMNLSAQDPLLTSWQLQINDAYHAREIIDLFAKIVLKTRDEQAKKLIGKSAAESAAIVAISPLALIDMLFVAWRSLRLVSQIATIYGIGLGYFSRIRLFRIILLNIALAGATELIREVGIDWLSQDITAKISARAAQGIGVGLLTARLGFKAMDFCRPIVFEKNEKPKLNTVHKELINIIKSTLLGKTAKISADQTGYKK